MPEDHLERRTYRKSPGRQYGYEYDPLQSRSEHSQTGSTPSRAGALLSQRPDPRRTRQLLRQSIIASKRLDDEALGDGQPTLGNVSMEADRSQPTRRIHHPPSEYMRPSAGRAVRAHHYADEGDEPLASDYRARRPQFVAPPHLPLTREFAPEGEDVQEGQKTWPRQKGRYVEPAVDTEDGELDELEQEAYDYPVAPQVRGERSGQLRPRHATTRRLPEELLEEDGYEEDEEGDGHIYEEDEELPPGLRVVKKPSSSRRKFLIGAGILVAGGVGVGVLATQPTKSPSLLPSTNSTDSTDKQVKNAFDQGLAQGADQAKRELIAALGDLESYTLQGAIDAALLTRQAYDVFVSPVIKFGAALTGDFLGGMLGAFKVARSWLASINQDNATLAAIQSVLESWVAQAQSLPKQLDAITQTDLDGAQGYLRALQRKIAAEQSTLSTPTPTPPAGTSPASKK